jgi:Flp pilus assembly pilin Flp
MLKFANSVKKFIVSEDGPTAVEYAVMLALIIVVWLQFPLSVVLQTANSSRLAHTWHKPPDTSAPVRRRRFGVSRYDQRKSEEGSIRQGSSPLQLIVEIQEQQSSFVAL